MKTNIKLLALLAGLAGGLVASPQASAQMDPSFEENDIVMFFRNPNGTIGTTQVVTFSLGNATERFRAAATPGDPTYGTTIFLGNINAALSGNYGTDWTSISANSTLFGGAVGQKGGTTSLDNTVVDGDYARTAYFTRRRNGAGTVGSPNSTNFTLPAGGSSQANIVSNIQTANNVMLSTSNPHSVVNTFTIFDDRNPINSSNVPGTAFTAITGGVLGRMYTTPLYTMGTVNNIVLGLDLYRATPLANQTGSWELVNSISGVGNRTGYYLGTITLSTDGDVNFIAVPEPSTAALLALGLGAGVLAARRRTRNNKSL